MIGKKKTKDVQFCTEGYYSFLLYFWLPINDCYYTVMEGSSHLDGRSSRDEIEDEQAEAELRNKLNKDFQAFIKRIEDISPDIEFDIPYLNFYLLLSYLKEVYLYLFFFLNINIVL